MNFFNRSKENAFLVDTDVLEDFIEASVSSIANSAPNGISVDTKAVFLDKLENSSLQNIAKHFSEFDEEMIFYLQVWILRKYFDFSRPRVFKQRNLF